MPDGGLIAAAVAPHTPFLLGPEVPARLRGVRDGCRELGRLARALEPDLLVINSSHWNTPFLWYVTGQEHHRGRCTSDKDKHWIPPANYDYPGDPNFAHALADAIAGRGLPSGVTTDTSLAWDYGSYVPASFLAPDIPIPVVILSCCLMATLEECADVARLIDATARRLGRRAVFVASTCFAHKLEAEPECAPSPEILAADLAYIDLLRRGRLVEAWAQLPEYAAKVYAELAGRSLAMFLGSVADAPVIPHALGEYGHSSGSGNFAIALVRESERAFVVE